MQHEAGQLDLEGAQAPSTAHTNGKAVPIARGTSTPPKLPAVVAPRVSPPTREEDFWSPDNEDVLMPEQRSIAIYTNSWKQIVIRQEATGTRRRMRSCSSPLSTSQR
jgi:hypothetical protein